MICEDYTVIEVPLVKQHGDFYLMLLGEKITEINRSASVFIDSIFDKSNFNNIELVCKKISDKYNTTTEVIMPDLIYFIRMLASLGGLVMLNRDYSGDLHINNKHANDFGWVYKLAAPVYIAWNLTSKCNIACSFCYSRGRTGNLPLESNKMLLHKLIDANILEIGFGGGECFLYEGFFDLAKMAVESNIRVSVTTNGTVFSSQIFEAIKNTGFHSIAVSFDSSNSINHNSIRGDGNFEKAKLTAEKIVSLGVPLEIVTVITKKNMDDIINIAEFGRNIGARKIIFKEFKQSGLGAHNADCFNLSMEEKMRTWEKILRHQDDNLTPVLDIGLNSEPLVNSIYGDGTVKSCSCGTMSACLRENGQIAVCSYSDNFVGNLLDENLIDIWKRVSISKSLSNKGNHPVCGAVAYLKNGKFPNLTINN